MIEKILAAGVLVLWMVLDPVADAWATSPDWWKRHIPDWATDYALMAVILFFLLPWPFWIAMPVLGLFVWPLSAKYLAKRDWPNFWQFLKKRVFK